MKNEYWRKLQITVYVFGPHVDVLKTVIKNWLILAKYKYFMFFLFAFLIWGSYNYFSCINLFVFLSKKLIFETRINKTVLRINQVIIINFYVKLNFTMNIKNSSFYFNGFIIIYLFSFNMYVNSRELMKLRLFQ